MISISKDKKSDGYILTQTDSEGFHKQLTLNIHELRQLSYELDNYKLY